MDIERTGDGDRGAVEIGHGGTTESPDALDGWWALTVWLAALAIALCVVTGVVQVLEIALQPADGYMQAFAQPEPDKGKGGAREPLEDESDPLIAAINRTKEQMHAADEATRWIGGYPASTPRTFTFF